MVFGPGTVSHKLDNNTCYMMVGALAGPRRVGFYERLDRKLHKLKKCQEGVLEQVKIGEVHSNSTP